MTHPDYPTVAANLAAILVSQEAVQDVSLPADERTAHMLTIQNSVTRIRNLLGMPA